MWCPGYILPGELQICTQWRRYVLSEDNKGFVSKIFGVITSPGRGFQDIEERDLRTGLFIVFLAAILSAWAGMIYFSKTELNLLAAGLSGTNFEASRLTPFIAIGGIVSTFIRWLVPSILVILTAKVLVGKGNSRRMLAMTGFAFTPMVGQQLLRVVDAYTISAADLASLTATRAAASGLLGRLVNQAFTLFNLFGVLTLILTAVAVSVNYEATPRKAAFVTVSAYVAYMILRVYLPIL